MTWVHIRPSNFVQVLSFSWQESSSKHFFWLNQCSKDLFWRNVLNVQLFWKKKGNSFWWFPNFVKNKKKKHGNLIIFTFQTLLLLLKAKLTINTAEKILRGRQQLRKFASLAFTWLLTTNETFSTLSKTFSWFSRDFEFPSLWMLHHSSQVKIRIRAIQWKVFLFGRCPKWLTRFLAIWYEPTAFQVLPKKKQQKCCCETNELSSEISFFVTKKKKTFCFLLLKLKFHVLLFWNTWELILVLMQLPEGSFLKKLDEFMERFGTFHESKSKQKKISIEAKGKPFSCTKNENAYLFDFGDSGVLFVFFSVFFLTISSNNFCSFLSIFFVLLICFFFVQTMSNLCFRSLFQLPLVRKDLFVHLKTRNLHKSLVSLAFLCKLGRGANVYLGWAT